MVGVAEPFRKPLRQRLEQRLGALQTERSDWEPHWRDLAEFILPRRARFLTTERNRGKAINTRIVDGTATLAVRTLASGMMSGITSPSRPWFRFVTRDPGLMEYGPVKAWLFEVERRMREVLAAGNLYNALHTAYEDLGVFGTAALVVVPDDEDIVRAYALPAGSYYLANGARLAIDTLYRDMSMTVGQVVEAFGLDAASTTVRNLYDRGAYDQWVEVGHAIEPRRDRDPDKIDGRNKPVRSVYWEKGGDGDKLLRESGFDRFPAAAPRWHVTGYDVYGRSPGMDALPDVKQLQLEQRRKAQAIDKLVNPPMVAPPTMQTGHANLLPGGLTYVDEIGQGQGGGFRPAYQVQPRLGEMAQDIAEVQARIRQAFYADLFLMLAQSDRRQITATEIEERRAEKMLALGPVLERLQDELINPVLDLTFEAMADAGILPPAPPELEGDELTIELSSMLARDQRVDAIIGIERMLGLTGNLAATSPEVIDKINADEVVDEYSQLIGVPPTIVRSDDEVARIRQSRQQQQAVDQTVATVGQGAQAAKVMSEAKLGDPNLLSSLTGQF